MFYYFIYLLIWVYFVALTLLDHRDLLAFASWVLALKAVSPQLPPLIFEKGYFAIDFYFYFTMIWKDAENYINCFIFIRVFFIAHCVVSSWDGSMPTEKNMFYRYLLNLVDPWCNLALVLLCWFCVGRWLWVWLECWVPSLSCKDLCGLLRHSVFMKFGPSRFDV